MILTCTQEKVLDIATENFGPVGWKAPLRELGDSLEIANFVLDIEQEFGIDVPDDAIQRITDLDGVVDYLEKYGTGSH